MSPLSEKTKRVLEYLGVREESILSLPREPKIGYGRDELNPWVEDSLGILFPKEKERSLREKISQKIILEYGKSGEYVRRKLRLALPEKNRKRLGELEKQIETTLQEAASDINRAAEPYAERISALKGEYAQLQRKAEELLWKEISK